MINECCAAEMESEIRHIHTRIASIEDNLEFLKATSTTVSNAQALIAQSAESMATTFEKFERRIERQDDRYAELVKQQDAKYAALIETMSGKDHVPLKSHYLTIMAAILPGLVVCLGIVLVTLYMTKQEFKASLSDLQIGGAANGR